MITILIKCKEYREFTSISNKMLSPKMCRLVELIKLKARALMLAFIYKEINASKNSISSSFVSETWHRGSRTTMLHQHKLCLDVLPLGQQSNERLCVDVVTRQCCKLHSLSPCGNDGPFLTSSLPVVHQSCSGSQPSGLALLASEHTSAPRQRTSLTPTPACSDS